MNCQQKSHRPFYSFFSLSNFFHFFSSDLLQNLSGLGIL